MQKAPKRPGNKEIAYHVEGLNKGEIIHDQNKKPRTLAKCRELVAMAKENGFELRVFARLSDGRKVSIKV